MLQTVPQSLNVKTHIFLSFLYHSSYCDNQFVLFLIEQTVWRPFDFFYLEDMRRYMYNTATASDNICNGIKPIERTYILKTVPYTIGRVCIQHMKETLKHFLRIINFKCFSIGFGFVSPHHTAFDTFAISFGPIRQVQTLRSQAKPQQFRNKHSKIACRNVLVISERLLRKRAVSR